MTINAWEERQQFVALLYIIQFNQKRLQYFSSGNLGHVVVVNVTENQYLILNLQSRARVVLQVPKTV